MAQTKKLSVATVYGKIDPKEVLNAKEPIKVMRVMGQAVGTKAGTSSYGDWTSLVGQFKAVNPDTGKAFEASTLFLPEVALLPIQVALAQGDARGVTFAIDLYVKEAASRKPGGSVYEYSFEHVLPPVDSDPIAQLEARIAEATAKALPDESGKGDAPAAGAATSHKGRK